MKPSVPLLLLCLAPTSTASPPSDEGGGKILMPPGCVCRRPGAVDDEYCDQFDCEGDAATAPQGIACVERPPGLEATNLQYPYRVDDSPEHALLGLLCVEKNNSAVTGNYYRDQGYPSAGLDGSPFDGGAGFHTASQQWRQGDDAQSKTGALRAFRSLDGGTLRLAPFGGLLTLPTSSTGAGGRCLELNPVAFGQDLATSCTKQVDDLANDCEGALGLSRYTSGIYLARTANATTSSAVLGQDPASAAHLVVPVRVEEGGDRRTRWDEGSSTCSNALGKLSYVVVYHDATEEIVDVSATLEAVDVVDDGQVTSLEQQFEIAFVPHGELGQYNSTLYTRPAIRSPGYVQGDAVVAAAAASSAESANATGGLVRAEEGLRVMNFGEGGECSSASSVGTAVGFAKDLRVGCVHRMTRNELRNLCVSAGDHPLLTTVAGGLANGDAEYVHPRVLDSARQDWLGIFANAEENDRRQWVEIEPGDFELVARKRREEVEFVDSESRCVGIPTRLSYEILWTHAGNVDSPHAKILGARRTYGNERRLQHILPPDEEQPYTFDATVSWTYREPEPELVVKPPPAHIFSVPYDIWYPFVGAPDDEEF